MSEATKAIRYAEDVLGAHQIKADADAAAQDANLADITVVQCKTSLRMMADRIAEREYELLIELRAAQQGLSATATEQEFRLVKRGDSILGSLRQEEFELRTEHENAEQELRDAERRVKIAAARMTELGGLLFFYGTTKLPSDATDQSSSPTSNE